MALGHSQSQAGSVYAQEDEVPAKPTGLSATATHDRVALSWDDPQDGSITGYVILRRNRANTAPGEFTVLVADTDSAATEYTDHGVESEAFYTYRIRAINEHGVSELSLWARADTPAPPVPAAPTGLRAVPSHDRVALSWDDPQDDSITGYVILRRNRANTAPGEFTVLVADTDSAATEYTDHGVESEAFYTYRIRAINEHGVSELSLWARADTPAPPVPAAPTGLRAAPSHDRVALSWDDPQDDNITGYVILRRNRANTAPGEFTVLVADTDSAATEYTDHGVESEAFYTYRIRAINEHGVSELPSGRGRTPRLLRSPLRPRV